MELINERNQEGMNKGRKDERSGVIRNNEDRTKKGRF